MKYALIALALIATPATAQEIATTPLRVETTQTSATATLILDGARVQSCETPCTLQVPDRATFQLQVRREGYASAIPALRWENGGVFGLGRPTLQPSPFVVEMRAIPPKG